MFFPFDSTSEQAGNCVAQSSPLVTRMYHGLQSCVLQKARSVVHASCPTCTRNSCARSCHSSVHSPRNSHVDVCANGGHGHNIAKSEIDVPCAPSCFRCNSEVMVPRWWRWLLLRTRGTHLQCWGLVPGGDGWLRKGDESGCSFQTARVQVDKAD